MAAWTNEARSAVSIWYRRIEGFTPGRPFFPAIRQQMVPLVRAKCRPQIIV
jgi:hypothetical protein